MVPLELKSLVAGFSAYGRDRGSIIESFTGGIIIDDDDVRLSE